MRNSRTLALKRETLSPLTTDELGGVAGASHLCATDPVTHPSFDESCPTLPVAYCFAIHSGQLGCIVRTIDCPTV